MNLVWFVRSAGVPCAFADRRRRQWPPDGCRAQQAAAAPGGAPTKDFLVEAQPNLININSIKVHPGTQLWHELVGPGEPATLKEADSRNIFDFPGQTDQATLAKQAREIYQFYLRRQFRWGNGLEFLRLLRYNPLVRLMIWFSLKKISVLLQLLKLRHN